MSELQTNHNSQIQALQVGVNTLTNREAVLFWADRLLEMIETEGFPSEVGMLGKLIKPLLGQARGKLENISEAEAGKWIDGIHALSYRLEDQTGHLSRYHYQDAYKNDDVESGLDSLAVD